MLQNYLTLALRNLLKNKTFSLLNIVGWALGMAICIAMLLFVEHEQSFDRFHAQSGQIYRLTELQKFDGTEAQVVPLSMWQMAPMFQKDYPEIKNTVRVRALDVVVLKAGERQISSETVLQVDSTFLSVFDFQVLTGDPITPLRDVSGMVLSAAMAHKLFGTSEVTGKIVEVNRGEGFQAFKVSAVLKDVPENSHLQFEALLPMHEMAGKMQDWMEPWDANWLVTYLLFQQDSKPDKVIADLPNYVNRYMPTQAKYYDLSLQALPDVHLGSTHITHDEINYQKFDGRYIGIFGWLAAFVLLIASFNFVNITIARTTQRAREVGIRKAIGAQKGQLIGQFAGEAVLTSLFALGLALAFVWLGLPALSGMIDRKLTLPLFSDPYLLPSFLGVTIVTGLLSGIYPAIIATAFKPVTALKGEVRTSENRFSLRSGLVVLQFSIAISLIIATMLAVRQLNFIRDKNLGFDKSQVLQVPMNSSANEHFEALKTELLKSPYILAITASGQRLGNNLHQMGARSKVNGTEHQWSVSQLMVDYNYLEFFNIQLLDGRNFSKSFAEDKGSSFIINEAFVREIGVEKMVGQPFRTGWQSAWGSVIGVVKDFNFNSLHHKVAPVCISIQPWTFQEMSVKINPQHSAEALQHLENTWKQFVPDLPFEYTFLDDHFAKLYKTDTQVSRVVSVSSFLAILIACMGLFGLALFVVQTRTKEIGIRKVLGASVAGITGLLAKDFLKLVVIAILIASPLAYYGMQRWLADFAYRIDMHWWIFAAAGLVALAVAFLTVSFQSIKAALANPVDSLRNE